MITRVLAVLLFAGASALPASAADLLLPQGTPLLLELKSPLSSIHSRPGDRFYLVVAEPVIVDGQTIIPAGARAVGEVTRVQRKGDFGKSGELAISLRHAMVGATAVPIEGHEDRTGETGDSDGIAAASILLTGLLTGKSASISPGTRLQARTSADVRLPPPAGG
jgi:hypothetical protein